MSSISSYMIPAGTQLRIVIDGPDGYKSRITLKTGEDMTFSIDSRTEYPEQNYLAFRASGLINPDFADVFNSDCKIIAPRLLVRINYD